MKPSASLRFVFKVVLFSGRFDANEKNAIMDRVKRFVEMMTISTWSPDIIPTGEWSEFELDKWTLPDCNGCISMRDYTLERESRISDAWFDLFDPRIEYSHESFVPRMKTIFKILTLYGIDARALHAINSESEFEKFDKSTLGFRAIHDEIDNDDDHNNHVNFRNVFAMSKEARQVVSSMRDENIDKNVIKRLFSANSTPPEFVATVCSCDELSEEMKTKIVVIIASRAYDDVGMKRPSDAELKENVLNVLKCDRKSKKSKTSLSDSILDAMYAKGRMQLYKILYEDLKRDKNVIDFTDKILSTHYKLVGTTLTDRRSMIFTTSCNACDSHRDFIQHAVIPLMQEWIDEFQEHFPGLEEGMKNVFTMSSPATLEDELNMLYPGFQTMIANASKYVWSVGGGGLLENDLTMT